MTTLIVGRSAACDIVLDDPTVSRRHAALTRTEAGSYRFVDQGSTSGSYRMEEGSWRPMTDVELRDGDRLRLGDYETTVAGLLDRAMAPGAPPDTATTARAEVAGAEVAGEASDPPPAEAPGEAEAAPPEDPRPVRRVVERDPATGRIVIRPR